MNLRVVAAGLCAWIAIAVLPYVGPWRWWSALPVALIGAMIGWRLVKKTTPHVCGNSRIDGDQWIVACSILFLQAMILAQAIVARTDDGLVSPWERLPWAIVLAYIGASFLLVQSWSTFDRRLRALVVFTHAVITWGILEIVFALGYGFDPFLHRAAELALVRDGAIHPTPLYYMGQYSLVAFLHLATHLPIELIDRILVPLSASLLAAWMAYRNRSPILFFYIFPAFTFTVPYQLAIVLGIFAMLVETRSMNWLLIVLSCLAHPLIGIPFGVFVLMRRVVFWRLSRVLLWVVASTCVIASPMLVYGSLHGQLAWPHFAEIWNDLYALFGTPYRTEWMTGWWGLMYELVYLWPWILCAIGIVLGFRSRDRELAPSLIVACSTTLAAIVIFTTSRFDGIISSEQGEFALRLIHLAPMFFLGMLDRALGVSLSKLSPFRMGSRRGLEFAFACCMTFTFYNALPQSHPAALFYAPSLSHDDLEAVHHVEEDAHDRPYVLLAHQMGSAAAVHELGYNREVMTAQGKRYFSAIPTGGELYAWYARALESEHPREEVQAALQFANVDRAYVMVPLWWDPSGEIANRLRRESEAELQSENVWIFRFNRQE